MKLRTAVLVVSLVATACSKDSGSSNNNNDVGVSDTGVTPDVAADADASATDTDAPDADPDASDAGPDSDAGGCSYVIDEPESIPTPDRIHTPRWAFKPWISKDISDTSDSYAFVDGFITRDIPVGTLVLDSPWETSYNTFIPNPTRYPDFDQLVSDLRDRDVRMVLWVTNLTNQSSFDAEPGGDIYDGPASNYTEGLACDFYINNGRNWVWWKGAGGAVDFTNPTARQWWHEQQDPLFDMGIAGWKLDFGDSYVRTNEVDAFAGTIPHQQYSESYYKDFYDYGIHRMGHDEFVTMVRAWDASYDFAGRFYARPEHAPIVWVGDNRRDWFGLEDALDHTFRSAAAGYVVVGSDLGGYLNIDDMDFSNPIPFDRTNFHRWLAWSALTPFMQLHGRANITPWTLPDDPDVDESVANYRFWAHLHTDLIPFWYSLAQSSYAGDEPGIIRPLGDEASWAGDYRYTLGEALLVAPILDATGVRDVELPAGTYYDWWDDAAAAISGGTTVTSDHSGDLRTIPLFVKAGALIPVESSSSASGITGGGLGGADIVLAWPDTTATQFTVHTDAGSLVYETEDRGPDVRFVAPPRTAPLVVRLRFDGAPASVSNEGVAINTVAADEAQLLASAPAYRVDGPYVWVSLPASPDAAEIVVAR